MSDCWSPHSTNEVRQHKAAPLGMSLQALIGAKQDVKIQIALDLNAHNGVGLTYSGIMDLLHSTAQVIADWQASHERGDSSMGVR